MAIFLLFHRVPRNEIMFTNIQVTFHGYFYIKLKGIVILKTFSNMVKRMIVDETTYKIDRDGSGSAQTLSYWGCR